MMTDRYDPNSDDYEPYWVEVKMSNGVTDKRFITAGAQCGCEIPGSDIVCDCFEGMPS